MTSVLTPGRPVAPAASLLETASGWPGVTTQVTSRGSTAIVLDGRELGHVHLDRRTLDMPVGVERQARLVDDGRAKTWFADWVSKPIADGADVSDALQLLRESYDEQRAGRTPHLLELMRRGDEAFNARDIAAMEATHHPEMIAHVTGRTEPLRGRQAHTAAMKAMFSMFPDVHVDSDPYLVTLGSGDWITVITRARGTFAGEMVLPDGSVLPPTGKAFDVDFGTTARWQGDLLIEEYVMWDSALQAQQIGL